MWMADHGARNIVIMSRSGATRKEAQEIFAALTARNVIVKIVLCDVTDASKLQQALEECQLSLPPIKGAILGAMVLQDAIFENMTYEDFVSATRPKIQGSWNLHNLLPKDLDFFVCLSS